MKKRKIAALVMVAIAVLAAFSIIPAYAQGNPGAGCISETKFYDTIHGGIYFEQHGWRNGPTFTTTFNNVPDGTIKFAKVYTGVWAGSPGKGGQFNITVNGDTSPTYQACDPCPEKPCAAYQSSRCNALDWSNNSPPNVPSDDIHDYVVGCNVHFISYTVTSLIHSGSNTVTVRANCCDNCTCWYCDDIYLIALIVVYEDSSMPEVTCWINEGAPHIEKGSQCDGPEDHLEASFYFDGTHLDNPEQVTYSVLGWPHVFNACEESAYTKLNGNNIGCPDHLEAYDVGYNEVFVRYDDIPIGYLDPNSNFIEYYDPGPKSGRAYAAWLLVQGPSEKPDLTVTDINVCWPDNCTICYNVTNTGDGTAPACHNTALYVDDVEVAQDHVSEDLAPGESYTGCFNGYEWGYTPPSDEIRVCADSNEALDELDESNNCLSDIWMCGDVTGDDRVRTSDGRRIFRHLTFGDSIDNLWAADVTGDGRVRTSDGRRIFRHLTFGDPLDCKCSD